MEHRSYELDRISIRQDGSNRQISGYAAVFNRMSVMLGRFREQIAPGAFAESLREDVRALWQHDSAQVLGRTRSGTLSLWEDERGLGFELQPADTQAGRDALTLIERGDVDQMSFGFNVLPQGDLWEEDDDGLMIRTLTRVKLIEVSPVTFPAYPDTSVDIVRNAPEWVQRALNSGANDSSTTDEQARARTAHRKRQYQYLALGGRL